MSGADIWTNARTIVAHGGGGEGTVELQIQYSAYLQIASHCSIGYLQVWLKV